MKLKNFLNVMNPTRTYKVRNERTRCNLLGFPLISGHSQLCYIFL